jgi:hypothetical protein
MSIRQSRQADEVSDLLKDLMIVQLGIAGVKQSAIREIVGCDIVRVNRIVKHLRSNRQKIKGE